MIPMIYMLCEIFIYFSIVVFIDGFHHDPHLKSFLHKLRCIKLPGLPQRDKSLNSRPRSSLNLSQVSTTGVQTFAPGDRSCSFGLDSEKRLAAEALMHERIPRNDTTEEMADTHILVVEGVTKWDFSRAHKVYYIPKLTCRFKAKRAIIHGATFTVKSQSVMGLVGLNGSGMSSMINLIAGKTFPTTGKVWLDGVDLSVYPYHRWGRIGMCSQVNSLLEEKMTGREILEMFGRISMIDPTYLKRTLIPEALQLVGLKDMKNTPVSKYSQGDKRKLSFILSLMTGAKLLLLDSPSLGLDVLSRRRIWSVIAKVRRNTGRAVVLSSPVTEECETLCDRIGVLEQGIMLAIGKTEDIRNRLSPGYEVKVNVCAYEQFTDPSGNIFNKELTQNDYRPSSSTSRTSGFFRSSGCGTTLVRHFSDPRSVYRHQSTEDIYTDYNSKSESRHELQPLPSGLSIVVDRANTIVNRLVSDLGHSFKGAELVELFDSHARIYIPSSKRRKSIPARLDSVSVDIRSFSEDDDDDLAKHYRDPKCIMESVDSSVDKPSSIRLSTDESTGVESCNSSLQNQAREPSIESIFYWFEIRRVSIINNFIKIINSTRITLWNSPWLTPL